MRIIQSLRLLAAGAMLVSSFAFAQNVSVNPGAGSYPDLGSAFAAINAGTHTGAITVSITGDTTEAATAVLNASGVGAASYTSIVVTPSGTRTVSGAVVAGSPLIDLNGADNVTFDGLNSGGNALTIANTTVSPTSGTSTIRFIGGATGNTITNASVLGSGTMSVATNGGNIFFSTDAITANGNDNNTISNSNIGPAGANLPSKGIYGNGSQTTTAIGNSGITITNNNIFDFFAAAVNSAGVATGSGCNTWTISNNRFYQSATRTWTTGANHRAIDIGGSTAVHGAQGFTITGNTIGYASNTQTGTYNLTGSTGKFLGIQFNGITGGAATTISNNTIAAVSLSGVTSSGTGTSAPLIGILVTNGPATTNGNAIGSQTAIGSVVFSTNTTTATDVYGIYNFSVDPWTSIGNSVGGFTLSNAGATGTFIFYGLRANTGGTLPWIARDNLVGGTIANSIQNNSTSTGAQTIGMLSSLAVSGLRGNTIRNLTGAGGTGTAASASVIGISLTSTTPNHVVEQNTISALSNTSATAATTVAGIQFTGGTGSNIVQRNLIHSLSVANATGIINGINVSGGTTTYRNNFIRLGTDAAGNAITVGAAISGFNEFLGTNQVFNNSIRIGGSGVDGTANTFAFNGQQVVNTRSFQNNIFVNARSNGAGTGRHYAMRVGGSTPNPAGLTSNFNLGFANGTGGAFGLFNAVEQADLAAWQVATGQDGNSISADPQFVSATDLHLTTGSPARDIGLVIASVGNDFDGDMRPGANALYDIGGDEFDGIPLAVNDAQATAFVDPTAPGFKPANVAFAPQASFTNNGTAGQTNVSVRYRILDAGANEVYNQTAIIATLASLDTAIATFPSATLATAGTYTVSARVELAVDSVPANDTITGTIQVSAPLAGTYSVGAAADYPTLSGAGGAFQALNTFGASANVTLNIVSDITTETGANGLNELAAGIAVRIQPTGAARAVSGASNLSLIRINGADNVTIDGSLTGATAAAVVGGDPALRNLGITNTSTVSGSSVVQVAAGATGAQNVVLRNLNVSGSDPTLTLIGIAVGGATAGTTGTDNDNIRIENTRVRRAILGIYNAGLSAANQNTGSVVTRNDITGSGPDRVRRGGVLMFNHDGAEVSLNAIGGIDTNEGFDAYGIALGTQDTTATQVAAGGMTNTLVSRNRIGGIVHSSAVGFSAFGIAISGPAVGTNTLVNNMISGVTAPSTLPDMPSGIFVVGVAGSSTRLHHNSIALTGDRGTVVSQTPSFGIAITGATVAVELRNNAVSNSQTTTGGGAGVLAYAIGTASTTFGTLSASHNLYFAGGPTPGFFRSGSLATGAGIDYATLALWQAATAGDANSLFGDPLFISASDLHLTATSPAINAGTPLASVTIDIDGDPRSATAPEIGADELANPNTPPSITASPTTRTEGNAGAVSTIATATDAEDAETALAVTVNGGASATVNGVAVGGIAIDASGAVTASVTAACLATSANFTLRATDTGGLFAEATLAVTVLPNTAPTLSYGAVSLLAGAGTAVNPATGPSDSGSVQSIVVQSTGTYTGGATVAPTGIVTLSNAGPVGSHTLVIRATDNCGAVTNANLGVTVGAVPTDADLSIVKTSSLSLAASGLIQYTLQVGNAGPLGAIGAVVADTFPASLSGVTWTCTPSGAGASCPANGSGNINAQVDLANGTGVVFAITAQLPATPPVSIVNTATVTAPVGTPDPNPANNTSTVTDALALFANGFEPLAPTPDVLRIEPATPGLVQRLALPASRLADLAVGAQAIEALSIVVGDNFVVLQVRRIGERIELRGLQRDTYGRWTIGEWQAFDARALVDFEWSTIVGSDQRTVLQSRIQVTRGN